ncbi:MAG: AMP-binding protein [Chloroflexota bacterium]
MGINQQQRIFRSACGKSGGGLRDFICGAASLNPNVVRGLMDLGFHVSIGYGLTETAPLISGVPDFESALLYNRPGTCGKVMPSGESPYFKLDEEGIGEIAYRGDNVMLGY